MIPTDVAQFPQADWTNLENRKTFFDHLKTRLGYKSMEDFYRISAKDMTKYGAKALFENIFQGSLQVALQSMYPAHHWDLWRLDHPLPARFWENQENQMVFMDWLGKELGFKQMEDWYQVRTQDIEQKGPGLLAKFGNSVLQLMRSVYPNHNWNTKDFNRRAYWNQLKNQKEFLDSLGKELKFKRMEHWYRVNSRIISEKGGKYLIGIYGGSPSKLLMSVYPEHKWKLHKFTKVFQGFWDSKQNQLEFVERIRQELGFHALEHLYQLTRRHIIDKQGSKLLANYKGSPSKLLLSLYPEHKWQTWKFQTVSRGYWGIIQNQKNFIDWAAKELNIKQMEYWYQVTPQDLAKIGGERLLFTYQGSVYLLVRSIYPEHSWEQSQFKKSLWYS